MSNKHLKRVIEIPIFGSEYLPHGFLIENIRSDAVNRVSREGDQHTHSEQPGGFLDMGRFWIRRINLQSDRLHCALIERG
jgi:hypothetical protein